LAYIEPNNSDWILDLNPIWIFKLSIFEFGLGFETNLLERICIWKI